MARQKYPSDGRPYFRCLTDILHDPKLNGDCPPDVFIFYIRLLAMLQQNQSRDGVIRLDRRALNSCAVREQHRHSLRTACVGAARKLYRLSVEDVHTVITVPNWAEIQGFAPTQLRCDSGEIPAKREEENRVDKKLQRAPAKPPRVRATFKPEPWSLELADLLHDRLEHVAGASFTRGWRNRWAHEIEKMPREIPELRIMEAAERSKRIEFAIEWALGPDNLGQQYEVVIRSAAALREKWPKLVSQAARKSRPARQNEEFVKRNLQSLAAERKGY